MIGPQPPSFAFEGFEGPLDLLLELVEEKKVDILTVRLGDLADEYLGRIRALETLPAEEVAAFLVIASRLVLLKARSLLPSLEPAVPEDEAETEAELRARLIEYAAVKGRATALGDRLRGDQRAFHREVPTQVDVPPRGGSSTALASAWAKVLALAARTREEEVVAPGERYSVEQRTAEIEALMMERDEVTFATLLGDRPTLGFAVVTFIALLDLYRRVVIDIDQDELFGEITVRRKATS